jgi:transcription antitermination factor NusG
MVENNKDFNISVGGDKFWFALYTKPKAEFKAEEQLKAVGVEHYLPVIIKEKQWSDRKKKITEPVIRGYIFIYADEKQRLLALEQYSIVRCVFDRGRAAKIPAWQIDNLKKMLNTKSEIFLHDGLIPGKKVMIKNGPFEGIIGIVKEYEDGKKTIAVSIDLLNRSIITHIPRDSNFQVLKEEDSAYTD